MRPSKTSVQSRSRGSNRAYREYNSESPSLEPACLKPMHLWVQQKMVSFLSGLRLLASEECHSTVGRVLSADDC